MLESHFWINKETPTQVFSCEFWKKNMKKFFKEHLRTTVSENVAPTVLLRILGDAFAKWSIELRLKEIETLDTLMTIVTMYPILPPKE